MTRRVILAALGRLWPPFLVLAGQGLQSVGNFVIGALIARFASVSALGDYALGVTILFLVGAMAETLVATPFTYLVLRGRSSTGQATLFGAALTATLGLTLLGGAIFGVVTLMVPGLAPLFPALPAALTTTLLREMIRRRHYAYGEPVRALLSDVLTIILQFAIIAWMTAAHRLSAASVFAATATACLLAIAAAAPGLRAQVRFQPGLLWLYCQRFFRYGRWLAMAGACQIVALQSFSWFLFLTADASATGAFTACLAISSLPNPFLVGLTNYARPAIIRVYATEGWHALIRQTMILAAAFILPVLLFAIGAIATGGRLLTLIYGPDLLWASGMLTWTILAAVAFAAGAPLQLLMLAIHRPEAIFHLHIGELVAAALIGLPLVLAFGFQGAAIGYLLTALAGAIVLLLIFVAEWRRRAEDPLPG